MKKILFILAICICAVATVNAQKSSKFTANLWEGDAPNYNSDPFDTAQVYVYLPAKKIANGKAIVICPGGGYSHLAIDHEGKQWAEFFQSQGIVAVVLKYRMPRGNPEIPIADAEKALQMVRDNAEKWGVDVKKVGIMGSSAGGHLAATIATKSKKSIKPNFQILFYPVISMVEGITHKGSLVSFLGKGTKKKEQRDWSCELNVTRDTPRAFICLADDDNAVLPINGYSYYEALYKEDVPASLFIYPSGGHGFGFRATFKYHIEMMMNLKAWLASF